MKKLILLLILALAHPAFGYKSEILPVSVPVQTKIESGSPLFFTLYFHNKSDIDKKIYIKNKIECFLRSDTKLTSMKADSIEKREDSEVTLKKGGFKILNYRLEIPLSFHGEVNIRINDYPGASFSVIAERKPDIKIQSYQTIDSMLHLYQPYLDNMTSYKPIYFLIGTDPEDSKFQLSFKYRFIDQDGNMAKKYPWMRGLHLGYTQTSFWDLESDSIPFEDTSYKPEIFYLSPNIGKPSLKKFRVFFQTGFQHESNGRGEDESKSTNFLYFKPIFLFFANHKPYGLSISPKFWVYVNNESETNRDLYKYRGFFELETAIGKADDFLIESSLYWSNKGGSLSIDLFYPIHKLFNNLDIYFQVQYTNALAESLLHYKKRNESLRLGFSIVR